MTLDNRMASTTLMVNGCVRHVLTASTERTAEICENHQMGLFHVSVISEEDRERVHNAALRILSQSTAIVEDEGVLKELKRRGAKVEEHSGRVTLPKAFVVEALQKVNRRPVMRRVSGKQMNIYGDNHYQWSLNIDPIIVDYHKGNRKPVVDDVARHARLSDALDTIDMVYKMDLPCPDVPENVSEFRTLGAFISNTTTAYSCNPIEPRSVRHWVRVAEIMAGGSLEEHPILKGGISIISPFYLDQVTMAKMRIFAEHGATLHINPCPIAGATSPFSMAGTLVQAWAELLFQLVITLVVRENVQILFCMAGQALNMRDGSYLGAGPVREMIYAAGLGMMRKFELPTCFGTFGTICSNFGLQNGVESLVCALVSRAQPGGHFSGSMGSIANATGMSPEQILFHHDLLRLAERYAQGIDFSEQMMAVDSIIEVGPKGNFLTEQMTLDLLRTDEQYRPPDFVYAAAGEDEQVLAQRLHGRAEDLINTHKPKVPQDRLEKALEYLRQEEDKVSGR